MALVRLVASTVAAAVAATLLGGCSNSNQPGTGDPGAGGGNRSSICLEITLVVASVALTLPALTAGDEPSEAAVQRFATDLGDASRTLAEIADRTRDPALKSAVTAWAAELSAVARSDDPVLAFTRDVDSSAQDEIERICELNAG